MSKERAVKNMKRLIRMASVAISVLLAYAVSGLFFDGKMTVTMVAVLVFAVISGIVSSNIEGKIDARYQNSSSSDKK